MTSDLTTTWSARCRPTPINYADGRIPHRPGLGSGDRIPSQIYFEYVQKPAEPPPGYTGRTYPYPSLITVHYYGGPYYYGPRVIISPITAGGGSSQSLAESGEFSRPEE